MILSSFRRLWRRSSLVHGGFECNGLLTTVVPGIGRCRRLSSSLRHGVSRMFAIPEVVEKVSWRLPLLVVASTTIAFLLLFVFSPYSGFLCLFLIAPVVCLTFVVLLVVAAFRKRSHQFLSL